MNKANVEISWNGVPAATGTTKTEFDNPFGLVVLTCPD
jgi:hypothetical protein